jgi:hypothetical protein
MRGKIQLFLFDSPNTDKKTGFNLDIAGSKANFAYITEKIKYASFTP